MKERALRRERWHMRNICGERNPSNDDRSDGVSGPLAQNDQLFSQPLPPPPLPVIPSELITEILLRLPVTSLVRFRCVCKQWNSIISDTRFAKLHLFRSTMDPTLNHHRLLLFNQTTFQPQLLSGSVKSLFNSPSTPFEDHNMILRHHSYGYHLIVGTCNGVVCLYDSKTMHLRLCNPSTRLISRNHPFMGYTLDWTMLYIGFGYDHVSDKYKAVFVFHDPTHQDVHRTVTKLYVFGDSCWTTIQNLNYLGYPTNGSGIFVGGNLNWVALLKGAGSGDPSHVIRTFNLGTETFGEVLLPDFGHDNPAKPPIPVQAALKNCLSVCYDWKGSHLVVWLMKEYGVKESWTNLMAIPHVEPQAFMFCPDRWPLCMSENGQVLLNSISSRVRTVIFNSKDGRSEYPPNFQNDIILYTQHIYLESLVSPCF